MEARDSSGRSAASRAAATRWGLGPSDGPLQARKEFLRRIRATDYVYDGRLIAELRLLTGGQCDTRIGRRLIAQAEGAVLREFAATGPRDPDRFQSAARDLSLRCESPLSRRWYEDWLSLADTDGAPRTGVALEYEKPAALRRPGAAAVTAIEAPEDWPAKPSAWEMDRAARRKEEASLDRIAGFLINAMRVGIGGAIIVLVAGLAYDQYLKGAERSRTSREAKHRVEKRWLLRNQTSAFGQTPPEPAKEASSTKK